MGNGHKPHSLDFFPVFISNGNYILHYTCNAPEQNVLDKYEIISVGKEYGCKDPREVLKIPLNVYKKKGFENILNKDVLKLNLEKLIRKLK